MAGRRRGVNSLEKYENVADFILSPDAESTTYKGRYFFLAGIEKKLATRPIF